MPNLWRRSRVPTKTQRREGSRVFEIKANVAEDKGLRHAKEDMWVLIKDARLEFIC